MEYITKKNLKNLHHPSKESHKGENGSLLIIAGQKAKHGALFFAVKTAAKIVDLVYTYSSPDNQQLIRQLQSKTAVFLPAVDVNTALAKVDCILIGMGAGINKKTVELTKLILKSGKKAVLDTGALKVLYPFRNLLNINHILTPHHREFRDAFHLDPNEKNAQKVSREFNCTVILKGKVDIIASPGKKLTFNKTGNVGMTKGGTGDALAGLCAAFFCNNNAYDSACAAAFINGIAGDELYKKVGRFYDAEDLIEQIPIVLKKLT